MKRALQNSMRSRCGFACRIVGLLVLLTGTVAAQSDQPSVAAQKPEVAAANSETSSKPKKPLPYDISGMPDVYKIWKSRIDKVGL
jgi:hypothetical protein